MVCAERPDPVRSHNLSIYEADEVDAARCHGNDLLRSGPKRCLELLQRLGSNGESGAEILKMLEQLCDLADVSAHQLEQDVRIDEEATPREERAEFVFTPVPGAIHAEQRVGRAELHLQRRVSRIRGQDDLRETIGEL